MSADPAVSPATGATGAPGATAARRCPACGAADLQVFFDAGQLPVFVNVLHVDEASARAAATGRIRLGSCPACDLVHNAAFDPRLVEYAPGYENSLHGSPTFQDWATTQAAALVDEHHARARRAVEVGGGRGEFMSLLVEAGLGSGLAVDPSAPPDACAAPPDAVTLERRLFAAGDVDEETALVLTRHVLEHLAEPAAFARMLADAARPAGAGLYVEVPNGLWTLRDLGVWDVIYEHCSYFTPAALRALLAGAGAPEARVEETFHGQFLAASAPTTGARHDAGAPGAVDQRALEAAFADARAALLEGWTARLETARASGRRLALWGAGSKGATFLNSFAPDLAEAVIACAVDVNPRKHGRFVAGSGHEVVAPGALAERGVDGLIVLNPAYTGEIRAMARRAGCEAEVLDGPARSPGA